MGGYSGFGNPGVSDDDLLRRVLGGDQFDQEDVGFPGRPRGIITPMTGGGAPNVNPNTPIGTTTPAMTSSMATRALPTIPEMNPGYDKALGKREQLQQPLDRSKYQLSTGRKIATALSGLAMGIGGTPPGQVAATVRGNLESPYRKAETDRASELNANATEVGGYQQDYEHAMGKYNAQMKQIELGNNMTREDNTFGGAVQEEKDASGVTHYYKIAQSGRKIEVPAPKGERPSTIEAGMMSEDPAVQALANKEFDLKARTEQKYRGKLGGKGGQSDKVKAKFDGVENEKKQMTDALEARIRQEQHDDGYDKQPPSVKKTLDMKYNDIRENGVGKIPGQRKIETRYGQGISKLGGHYNPTEYPNWQKNTARQMSQTTPTGSHTSQVSGKTSTQTTPSAGDRVRVVSPAGQHGSIPRAKLQQYLGQGYKQE